MNSDREGLGLTGMTVVFGSEAAVNELDLEVPQGEVLAVLGPSGCGKSTLLRAVGGLQPLDGGTVRWAGEDLTAVPAHRRGFGLMFQDHALFIHRTVAENIGFGLRMQRLPRTARMKRVGEILDLLDLDGFGDRTSGPSPAGRRSGWRWVGPWLLSHGC